MMTGSDSTPDFSWLNKNENEESPATEVSSEEDSTEESASTEEHSEADANESSESTTDDSEESQSVFNDDGEENEQPEAEESDGPTILMPGRQLQPPASDESDGEDPDDETVVLPAETLSQPQEEFLTDSKEGDSDNAAASEQGSNPSESTAEEQSTESQPSEPEATTSSATTTSEEPSVEKSNLKFILLASYASAITLIALVLLMGSGSRQPDTEQLESLPDVSPEPIDSITFVPVDATLPLGHTLKIGEKQRFGNIEVEPLRVVNEPLEFTHYDPSSKLTRPPTEPVYKLWVRFTNVSTDQEIAPLDANLLLRWVVKAEQQQEYSNQYLFTSKAEKNSDVIATYRHSKTSDWDMKDQKLGTVLAPGKSIETYIASVENTKLSDADPIHWRVQFRKGFSPNGNGVTTIFDVTFNQSDIQTTAPAKQSEGKESA